jgi:hypothetical protein
MHGPECHPRSLRQAPELAGLAAALTRSHPYFPFISMFRLGEALVSTLCKKSNRSEHSLPPPPDENKTKRELDGRSLQVAEAQGQAGTQLRYTCRRGAYQHVQPPLCSFGCLCRARHAPVTAGNQLLKRPA